MKIRVELLTLLFTAKIKEIEYFVQSNDCKALCDIIFFRLSIPAVSEQL